MGGGIGDRSLSFHFPISYQNSNLSSISSCSSYYTFKITCDDMIAVEEATLKFFRDNIGTDDTFRPSCAYVNENAIDSQIARDAKGKIIQATALRVELTYTTTAAFRSQLEERHGEILRKRKERLRKGKHLRNRGLRELQASRSCDSSNHHLCCSQSSINARVGEFCENLGCDFASCGGRGLGLVRPPGRPESDRPPTGGRPERPPLRPGVEVEEEGDEGEIPPSGVVPPESGSGNGVVDGRPNRPPRPDRPNR